MHLQEYRCLKYVIHQIGSKNEWKTLFLRSFILKPTEIAWFLLKNGTRDFENSPLFERSACFYVTISENFKLFQYYNFEIDFLENENLFIKTGVQLFN